MQPRATSLMRSLSVENADVLLSRTRAPLLKRGRIGGRLETHTGRAKVGCWGGRRLGAGGAGGTDHGAPGHEKA